MKYLHGLLFLLIGILGLLISACVAGGQTDTAVAQAEDIIRATLTPTAFPTLIPEMARPDSCPITQPQTPRFVPLKPYTAWGPNGDFWYGSNELWTLLRPDGIWRNLPKSEAGYGNKVFWWREGYVWTEEPEPELAISARQLDGDAVVEKSVRATNGYHPDYGSFMLTGIELPALGCWEITGEYDDNTLSFVVWVMP